jgi:hypothetical protein
MTPFAKTSNARLGACFLQRNKIPALILSILLLELHQLLKYF